MFSQAAIMKHEEYQNLGNEQKILARFQSLDNVLQAARAVHGTYDQPDGSGTRKKRRILQGVVTSSSDEQTVTVTVERRFTHPGWKKAIRKSRKYRTVKDAAGEEQESQEPSFKPGDRVVIQRAVTRSDQRKT